MGAALPALRRLLARKLVFRGKAVARGKAEYQLTDAGRKALASWLELLGRYRKEPPSDAESVLRIAALAWTRGKKREAVELLEQAIQRWIEASKSAAAQRPSKSVHDLSSLYRWMVLTGDAGRTQGEARALRQILSFLKQE